MKRSEVIILEESGVDNKRIEKLKKSLKGYKEIKEEMSTMEKIIIEKDRRIKDLEDMIKRDKAKTNKQK